MDSMAKQECLVLEVQERHELPVATRSLKNGAVVASVAMPVGTIRPTAARGADDRAGSLGEDGVGVDVAVAGERIPAGFAEQVAPACRLAQFGLELVGQRPVGGAVAVSEGGDQLLACGRVRGVGDLGLREAKNSCSWSLTRSQGGLPMTQEKPPDQPVAGSMSVAPLPTRKMWGNSTCQWKKRYWRVRSDDQVLGCG